MNKETAYKIARMFVDGTMPQKYKARVARWLASGEQSQYNIYGSTTR